MSKQDDIHSAQRVAAFLLSLDEAKRASVLRHMKEDVVAEVAQAMVDLDPRLSEASAVDRLYRELAMRLNGPVAVRSCDADELGGVLTESLGRQRGEAVLQSIFERRRATRPFLGIESKPPTRIARVLQPESPAVNALVLGHLDPKTSASVLQNFEREDAFEVVRRMATLGTPPASVLRTIAARLEDSLAELEGESEETDPEERLRSIAELLNYSDAEMEKGVLETLSEQNAEMASDLREMMFTWDDVGTIDKRSMQKILGTVDTKTLSIALKACSVEVESNVMNNLSARVREMVAEERELAGALPMTDVIGAREDIMRSIRAMIEAGEFRPSRASEDLVT